MANIPGEGLRFLPSEVEGIPSVTEAVVHPDRLELLSEGRWIIIPFRDIARWRRFGWWYRSIMWIGFGVRGGPFVGDRDWFHPPSRRFYRFRTRPVVTIYLPDEPREIPYGETLFRQIQDVMARGGFWTNDLG